MTERFLEQMAGGIRLPELDQVTRPCKVKKVERNTFSIILTQGLNRQIRRMCEACGCQVKRLAVSYTHLDVYKRQCTQWSTTMRRDLRGWLYATARRWRRKSG